MVINMERVVVIKGDGVDEYDFLVNVEIVGK